MKKMNKKRIHILFIFFSIGSMILIFRLYHLQVMSYQKYQSIAFREKAIGDSGLPRGGIFDCRGREMALSIQVPSACIITKNSKDPKALLDALSDLNWVDTSALEDAFKKDKGFVWIKRRLNPQERASLERLRFKEIEFITEHERFYPHMEVAGQVLGFVGMDGKGLEGLEFHFDRFLNDSSLPDRFLDAYFNTNPFDSQKD